jgi:hypothetical protein
MSHFTEQDVIDVARAKYGKPVCVDMMDEAMLAETLDEAVLVIMLDSAMWDSPTGDPFDTINS